MLPSHNEPFRVLHARLKTLISGHEQRLERMQVELGVPKRAVDLFCLLYRRKVGARLVPGVW